MAIDTATKRSAALGVGMVPGVILPVPDGTIDAKDRAQLGGVYLPDGIAPSWTFATTLAGWAAADTGVMGTNFLADGVPVPATRVMIAGIAHAQDGRRYVCPWPASGDVFYRGKVACRADGAMCIATAGTAIPASAWALTQRGEVLATETAPELRVAGVGLLYSGYVCMESVD